MLTSAARRCDLARVGVGAADLRRLVADGSVCQPLRGVYLPSMLLDDVRERARALALVLPDGAAVSDRTAAWLHGVDPRGPGARGKPLPLECVTDPSREPVCRPGVTSRVAALPPEDVVHVAGVPVASVRRTAIDLARFEPAHMGLACLDALAAAGSLTREALQHGLEPFAGGRGVVQARRLVSLCEPSAESFGESWTRLRVADAGFPRPQVQVQVHDRWGRQRYRLDLGWPDRRVGLEYDGEEFHSSEEHRDHDEERRRRLWKDHGWTVVGVGKSEVLGHSLALERGVGELLGLEPRIRRRAW